MALSAPPNQSVIIAANDYPSPVWATWFSEIWNAIKGPVVSTRSTMIANGTSVSISPTLNQYLMPDTFNVGDEFKIVGQGAGGWEILLGSGQVIRSSGASATASVSSTNRYNCITLTGIVKDTELVMSSHEGTLTFA